MSDPSAWDERRIASVVERLARQSEGAVSMKVIEGQVRAEFSHWDDVPLRDYVPIFVERRVTDELGLRRPVGSLGASRSRARRQRRALASSGR